MLDTSEFWKTKVTEGTRLIFNELLFNYPCKIYLSRDRKRKLGDYRALSKNNRQITINGNLDQEQFTLVLAHELAHLIAFEDYGRRIDAHGKEWKHTFHEIVQRLIDAGSFSHELVHLMPRNFTGWRANFANQNGVYQYFYPNTNSNGLSVADVSLGEAFQLEDGRTFKKLKQLRKYYLCELVGTNQHYKVHPKTLVKKLVK